MRWWRRTCSGCEAARLQRWRNQLTRSFRWNVIRKRHCAAGREAISLHIAPSSLCALPKNYWQSCDAVAVIEGSGEARSLPNDLGGRSSARRLGRGGPKTESIGNLHRLDLQARSLQTLAQPHTISDMTVICLESLSVGPKKIQRGRDLSTTDFRNYHHNAKSMAGHATRRTFSNFLTSAFSSSPHHQYLSVTSFRFSAE